MVLTVFRNRLKPEHSAEYNDLAPKIATIAAAMPGYVSHKSFTAADGERVTIVEFEDEQSHQAWAQHPEHQRAKTKGRDRLYEYYDIKVCTVDRAWSFHPESDPAD